MEVSKFFNGGDVEVRRIKEDIYVKVTQSYSSPEHGLSFVFEFIFYESC